jgi:hypothetical protein
MNKIYDIFLDENKIGTTELEKSDAPMGVAFGQIKFIDLISGYEFFKQYCLTNKIEFTDYPEDKLIMTGSIPTLKVADKNGIKITGKSTDISGTDNDTFDITVLGIPYPFYEEEFPHHVKAYHEMFK